MKSNTVIQNNTDLVTILCTFKCVTDKNTALVQCENYIYTEMLLAGCAGKTRDLFLKKLGILGSEINITTVSGFTTISIVALKSNLNATLKLVQEMLLQPNFEPKELKRVKVLITNNLLLSKENARLQVDRLFNKKILQSCDPRYPYPLDDLLKEVNRVSTTSLKKRHLLNLKAEWNIVFAGSRSSVQKSKDVFETIERNYTDNQEQKVTLYTPKTLAKNEVILKEISSKQNIEFNIGTSLPLTYVSQDYPAFVFGMSVLALYGGFSGRLMSTVREKEGLTYGIYGHIEGISRNDTGYWRIATFFSPENAERGLKSTLREIKTIIKHGITDRELKRVKSILETRLTLLEDSLIKKTRNEHSLLLKNISEKEYLHFKEQIQNMKKSKVNLVLKKYIDPNKLLITGVGPVKDVKQSIKKLFS